MAHGGHCDICKHYVPEYIEYAEDADCRLLEVCSLCLDNLRADGLIDDDGYLTFSEEEYCMGVYEVKYRADNIFEAVVNVKAANPKDAKTLALKSPDVIKLQSFGKVKFASVRLVERVA